MIWMPKVILTKLLSQKSRSSRTILDDDLLISHDLDIQKDFGKLFIRKKAGPLNHYVKYALMLNLNLFFVFFLSRDGAVRNLTLAFVLI